MVFLLTTCVLAMTIAIAFTLQGAWMVFPFTGLELAALAAALYVCARRGREYEIVTVTDDSVAVRKGARQPRTVFQRGWARIRLERCGSGWYPSRLKIGSHGREVEIGRCLNEEERDQLARALETAIQWPSHAGDHGSVR